MAERERLLPAWLDCLRRTIEKLLHDEPKYQSNRLLVLLQLVLVAASLRVVPSHKKPSRLANELLFIVVVVCRSAACVSRLILAFDSLFLRNLLCC